ncbi:MAG: flagellar filament capping protein FliD [Desulfarculus sp.]|nr:flagellar filament capping protein FliD [Desulfarculus sp.]
MATDATTSSSLTNLTSTLLSGSINFTGLGSGTDFNEIVDQLVKIESIHKTRMETWKATWESKITSMTALNQRLEAVEEAAGAMDTSAEFMALSATTSSSSVATAATTTGANQGAYRVTVGSAVPQILRSAGLASTSSTAVSAGGGTMILRVGSTNYNVTLTGGETLTQLRDAINSQASGAVTATIEDDGTSSRSQHLVLTAVTGGDAGRVDVVQNPTLLSFDSHDAALASSSLGVGVSVAGQFTGDKADGSVATYSFTVQNVSGGGTVGSDSFEISWTRSWDGGAASAPTVITVPANYKAGDSIEVEKGVFIQLAAGTVSDGQTFSVNAYANDIDEAEPQKWSGTSAVTTAGNYQGSVSKTYSFTVMSSGSIASGGGNTVVLRWTDSLGRTGTVSVSDSDQTYSVEQGFSLKLSAGTLVNGDTFQVNVFAPVQQQGQDKGLAQATKVVHQGFADKDITAVTTANATFSYTYNGQKIDVSVMSGTTLSQLATLINVDSDNPGVTASIINDGLGLPTSYKLVLTGKNSGAQYQISNVSHDFSGSSFGSGGELGGGFDITQLATNSMIKVDGYPSGASNYLQRSSNSIDGVINGVTLSLHDAGDTVVTVSVDTSAIQSKIEALINAVNYAQSYIREATKYDSTTKESGVLIGNYGYYIIKSRLDSTLNKSIAGLVDGQDTFTHLSQIGIATDPDNDGTWTIDSTMLAKALALDPEAVANLFIGNTAKGSTGAAQRVYKEAKALTDSETGMLNVLIKNYNSIIADIDTRIEKEEKRLELYRQRQLERFARLESTLSTLNSQSKAVESAIGQLPGNSSS